MGAAFGWGAFGASALLIGALIAYQFSPSRQVIAAALSAAGATCCWTRPAAAPVRWYRRSRPGRCLPCWPTPCCPKPTPLRAC
jgi:hypothetical protein